MTTQTEKTIRNTARFVKRRIGLHSRLARAAREQIHKQTRIGVAAHYLDIAQAHEEVVETLKHALRGPAFTDYEEVKS